MKMVTIGQNVEGFIKKNALKKGQRALTKLKSR